MHFRNAVTSALGITLLASVALCGSAAAVAKLPRPETNFDSDVATVTLSDRRSLVNRQKLSRRAKKSRLEPIQRLEPLDPVYAQVLIDTNNAPLRFAAVPGVPAAAAVNPEAAARAAIARLELRAIELGLSLEDGPDAMGAVGIPVWLWADRPGPRTVGPLDVTDTDGPVTVRLRARLTSVDWDMGDGTTVTCTGSRAVGTTYVDAYGLDDSPTCGHRYQTQGLPYTITATSRWSIEWATATAGGALPVTLTRSTQRTVGELQALTVDDVPHA